MLAVGRHPLPEYLPNRIRSPALTAREMVVPASVTVPVPTATTWPPWGFPGRRVMEPAQRGPFLVGHRRRLGHGRLLHVLPGCVRGRECGNLASAPASPLGGGSSLSGFADAAGALVTELVGSAPQLPSTRGAPADAVGHRGFPPQRPRVRRRFFDILYKICYLYLIYKRTRWIRDGWPAGERGAGGTAD